MRHSLAVFALVAFACDGSSSKASVTAKPVASEFSEVEPTEAPSATSKPEPPTTALTRNGCSVRLPGSWGPLAPAEGTKADDPEGWWEAESADGKQSFKMIGIELRVDPEVMRARKAEPAKLWLDLEDVFKLRREADKKRQGPRTTLTALQFFAHPTGSRAMYLLHDPDEPVRVATLGHVSPTRMCQLLLAAWSDVTDAEFEARAKSILDTVEAAP